jgi:wyosine [tRNA(Phe)-imidazoG37] synthetase (radical SAM superfamily)
MILLKSRSKHDELLRDICQNHIDELPYTFKIVPTSMFGQTLQIKAIPHKLCPGDCLYCPFGRTTSKIIDRESVYSIKNSSKLLEEFLKRNSQIDYIIVSGPGEPVLNADLHWLIDTLRKMTSIPIAVATCGSLLWRISVYNDLLKANAVYVNIDAADKSIYHVINRFHQQIPFDRFVAGLKSFHAAFSGDLFVRVCLLDGLNTQDEHFYKLVSFVNQFGPKAIFVSTSSVTIDQSRILAIDDNRLRNLAKRFGPTAQVLNMDAAFAVL